MGEVKPTGESLGTDENVNFSGFDLVVEVGEVVIFSIITVKAGDFGGREDNFKFGFQKFGAKTFMNYFRMSAVRAASGDFFGMSTDMTGEGVIIGMESHR